MFALIKSETSLFSSQIHYPYSYPEYSTSKPIHSGNVLVLSEYLSLDLRFTAESLYTFLIVFGLKSGPS